MNLCPPHQKKKNLVKVFVSASTVAVDAHANRLLFLSSFKQSENANCITALRNFPGRVFQTQTECLLPYSTCASIKNVEGRAMRR